MKETPEDSILSSKSKRVKREKDSKPYFNNTHPIFNLYENSDSDHEDHEDPDHQKSEGFALLKRIYGGGKTQSKQIYPDAARVIVSKVPYRDADRVMSDASRNKYFGRFTKALRKVPSDKREEVDHLIKQFVKHPTTRGKEMIEERINSYVNEGVKERISQRRELRQMAEEDLSGAGCNCGDVVGNYADIINHLEEHLREQAGDPLDAKQSRFLKKEIKNINAVNEVPANKIGRSDSLYKVTDPKAVQRNAFKIFGKDAVVYRSEKPSKKFKILNPKTGRFVHFGDAKAEDFLKHQDPARRASYIARASNIRGGWKANPYSPNFLSMVLLWNALHD